MNTAILSNKYQLVIPRAIRETNGIKAGTTFEVIAYNNRIELIPLKPIKKMRGVYKGIDTDIEREDDRV